MALTVDHGLRPESAAEAAGVGAALQARGIEHEVLRWEHPPLTGGVAHEDSRGARYSLLEERCRTLGILHCAWRISARIKPKPFCCAWRGEAAPMVWRAWRRFANAPMVVCCVRCLA